MSDIKQINLFADTLIYIQNNELTLARESFKGAAQLGFNIYSVRLWISFIKRVDNLNALEHLLVWFQEIEIDLFGYGIMPLSKQIKPIYEAVRAKNSGDYDMSDVSSLVRTTAQEILKDIANV